MVKRSTRIDDASAKLALSLIDLRAHFEAQLRTVMRAEEALLKCRTAKNGATFDAGTRALRSEIENVSDHHRTVKAVIDQLDTDAREVAFPIRK